MTEEFLQYVWKHVLFNKSALKTTDGKPVEIVHSGLHNSDAGPDFFNAKLQIGDTLWAGNVEIHIKSSDWIKHKHQDDGAYKNVILHVVWENDKEITLAGGFALAALELKNFVLPDIYRKYEELKISSKHIPCETDIHKVTQLTLHSWLDRLVAERLERKTNLITSNLNKSVNDWEETFYRLVLRTLGSPLNSEPFEHLAEVLPFKIINKHRADTLQVEALLLGQAGFLNESFNDEYAIRLQKEYRYLQHKLNLTPIDRAEWKFMRIRPPQFPTVRLMQLAALINQQEHLFRKAMEADTIYDIIKLFSAEPSGYWLTHLQPDKLATRNIGAIGKSTIEILMINAVIPTMFLYGRHTGKEDLAEKALDMLHALKPESNTFIKKWASIGITASDAYESQALLQLRKEYCDQRRCIYCAIGHQLMNVK
jgi:Protein of unknown function (DUF2851)